MTHFGFHMSRRTTLGLLTVSIVAAATGSRAATGLGVTVWKDPNCDCCSGWVEHLRRSGFAVTVIDNADLAVIKSVRGVPADLQSCHTATIGGYTIEGHVPAHAIQRLLAESPEARGLAVPGMPIGSPGMEGGKPEVYSVMQFGNGTPVPFGKYLSDRPV